MNQQHQILQIQKRVELIEIKLEEKLTGLESQIQELSLQQNKHKVFFCEFYNPN